jgi:hypothetical protein
MNWKKEILGDVLKKDNSFLILRFSAEKPINYYSSLNSAGYVNKSRQNLILKIHSLIP